jgi:hypothetical protein
MARSNIGDFYQDVSGRHVLTEEELDVFARYIGAVRVATQYLDEALVDEDQIQALDERCEAILAERKVFV